MIPNDTIHRTIIDATCCVLAWTRCHAIILCTLALVISCGASGVLHADDPPRNQLAKKQHRTSNAPFLAPQEALAKMAVPDGFDVTVFAAEPDIAEPIAFTFDAAGRLWVVENFNYRTRREHTDDPVTRVQILSDTDGDGVFDKKKTFADDLKFTSGIAIGHGGVYVGSPPNLAFIPDRNGDDVPDGPPQVLLDGWGINDRHETLNSFIWGPDGWLYGCHGVFTKSRVGKPGTSDENRQFIDGGIWRYHPTRDKFEIFARGLSNPWGFDFDDHGQSFATCCVIPHLFHIVPGGVYHKQSLPHVNPHIYDDIKTIRDHTHLSAHGGARFYLSDAFPSQYRNRLFMCNIHEHAVLTDVMVPKGSSFIGQHGDDFLPANDLAWVGFSIEIGPRGGVFVLDWHDTDVCGNTINFPNSGRIYRITHPASASPFDDPVDLRVADDVALCAMQHSPNEWNVRNARVQLHSRAAAGTLDIDRVANTLQRQFADASTSRHRLRNLWAMQCTGLATPSRLLQWTDHEDEHVRSWAIRLLVDASPHGPFQSFSLDTNDGLPEAVISRLEAIAETDDSPIVRAAIASAASRLSLSNRTRVLRVLSQRGVDADDANIPRLIWYALEPTVPLQPETALSLAAESKMPQLARFVSRRMVSQNVWKDPSGRSAPQSRADQNRVLEKIAKRFRVSHVGEGGVRWLDRFRNRGAVQTHPQDRDTPCVMTRTIDVAPQGNTKLRLVVSHHPHGDWLLRVKGNGTPLFESVVSSKSVTREWLEKEIDLSSFAGRRLKLEIENVANGWKNEWAYWNTVEIVRP